jgi:threonine dehydratase
VSAILSGLSLTNIEHAARVIDPVFLNSPQFFDDQLNADLGGQVLLKVETANPIRSFKGRGADFKMHSLETGRHVVCASAGNFGQAIAYAGRARGLKVTVFAAMNVNPLKRARMLAFGADLKMTGADFDAAKERAVEFAAGDPSRVFVEDGDDAAICEGAGTIAIELERSGRIDTVVVPVGDGALICGIAAWLKSKSPKTRIVGVCPSGAPSLADSWRAGRPVTTEPTGTIADGLAVRVPVPMAVERLRALVDDIVLVDDEAMIRAMRLAAATLGLVLEPSGAAGLAAIASHRIPGLRLATVLTGSNIHPELFAKLCGPA